MSRDIEQVTSRPGPADQRCRAGTLISLLQPIGPLAVPRVKAPVAQPRHARAAPGRHPPCSRRRPSMNASVVAPVRWRHHPQAVTESTRTHHGEDHRGCTVTPPGCWHTERIICTRCRLNSGGNPSTR